MTTDVGRVGEAVAELAENGYCVLRGIVPRRTARSLHGDLAERFRRTPFARGDFYGHRTKRFGALLKRSETSSALVANELVLGIAERTLGEYCDRIQLNLTQGLEIHPGEIAQAPHRDGDIWSADCPHLEFSLNVMWPLTPYTRANGATRVWPGSNRRPLVPRVDPDRGTSIEMDPGDALLFLGSTVHAAGSNRTDLPRTGVLTSYCLGWLKPYENQCLAYPPAVAREFAPHIQRLIGYQLHRPNLGNYEGQCPSVLLLNRCGEYLPAIEEMKADQASALRAFAEVQSLMHRTGQA